MSKTKPCTLAAKHKWTWVLNFTQGSMSFSNRGSFGRFTLKGKYRCECGAIRIGQPNHDGPDLRELAAAPAVQHVPADDTEGGAV